MGTLLGRVSNHPLLSVWLECQHEPPKLVGQVRILAERPQEWSNGCSSGSYPDAERSSGFNSLSCYRYELRVVDGSHTPVLEGSILSVATVLLLKEGGIHLSCGIKVGTGVSSFWTQDW